METAYCSENLKFFGKEYTDLNSSDRGYVGLLLPNPYNFLPSIGANGPQIGPQIPQKQKTTSRQMPGGLVLLGAGNEIRTRDPRLGNAVSPYFNGFLQ